jgi:membrane protein YqaA with SNARE-associated domain
VAGITYDWTLSLAAHPRALWALAFVAFIESSVFPIPPDVLMIAMIVATPRRAFVIAGVATVASVLGGLLGYAIGAFAFEAVGRPVLEALGKGAAIEAFNSGSTISGSGRC